MTATYTCLLSADIQGKELTIPALWKINASSVQRYCRTLDLVLKWWRPYLDTTGTDPSLGTGTSSDPESGPIHLDSGMPWSRFIIDSLERAERPGAQEDRIAVKFILADREGFCVRSDFLERRMEGYKALVSAQGFLEPRQEISRAVMRDEDSLHALILPSLLSNAVGALIVRDADALDEAESELDNRLSYPWIFPSCPPLTRIAWVRGRYNLDHSRRIWDTALALGIAVVILDKEGHWLQDAQWKHLREGFIPTNLDPDAGLADRLVEAIRGYGKSIHGITTSSNKRLIAVAKACEKLGLPTSSAESFIIAADKYKSREIEPPSDVTSLRVQNIEDLKDRLSSNNFPLIQYPLVVKPCIGWASECISKVHTETELVRAVEKASERHRSSPIQRSDVMIESYVEGPEIDANIILLDGEIAFFEVADDFPSMADYADNKWDEPFQETSMLFPSELPENEIDLIRHSLHQTLLRQGFKHGVFNCEGRVRYSRMKYGIRDGEEDLYEDEKIGADRKAPSFYLHEINARPPGYYGNVACSLTYGVDYYALDFLWAVGDMERYRSLAQPFKQGPQWWLVLAVIPETKEGIMKTGDASSEFLENNPGLKAAVPDHMTWAKRGSKLKGPKASQLSFVGYFYVISRKSRKEALQLASRIRREFNYELE